MVTNLSSVWSLIYAANFCFLPVDHFTVVYLVAWPLNESEAGVDHVYAVLMLISRNMCKKSREVSIKTKSNSASLSFKGQTTKHTVVEWSIANLSWLNV